MSEFLYFVVFLGLAGFIASKFISAELRKRNRFSVVEGILLGMTIIATINIPISLYRRYVDNNYNPKVIFGFGKLC
jgi:putative effector of murein hydrolase